MIRLLPPLFALLVAFPLSAAVDEDDLLPVEEAFALTANADDDGNLRLKFKIADGYYLYRHRLGLKSLDVDVEAGELQLPAGKQYTDEFFGEVETYRGELAASSILSGSGEARSTRFEVRFQGCADVGVCYPPHKQTIEVSLPPRSNTGATAFAGLSATDESATADNPLAKLLNQTSAPAPLQDDAPAGREPPLPPEQAFVFEAITFSPTQILARFTMPPGYYLYRDNAAFSISSGGATIGGPRWPAATAHVDDHFGEVFVFFDQIEVPIDIVPAHADVATSATITADFQGCQLDGICYPPMKREIAIELPPASAARIAQASAAVAAHPNIAASMPLRDTGGAESADASTSSAAAGSRPGATAAIESETDRLTGALAAGGWLTLGGFFLAGVLLAFTPCVLPMVPILSGLIAGAGSISTRRAFVLSLAYVLASAIVFTLAGVIAGLAGQNLQALFQKPWILISFALLFVVLSFSMFGFYELQLPARWQTKLAQVSNRQSGGSLTGVVVMGMLSALIVGPCVAPPLAAAVAYIGRTGDPVLGGSALFALAMGMGVPLIVVGIGAGRWLPRAGGWMDTVKAVFGVMFLFLAWWMLERILPPAWTLGLLGTLLIGSGTYLGALQKLPEGSNGWRKLWQSLGVILLVLGTAQLVGALSGANDYLRPFARFGAATPAVSVERNDFRKIADAVELDAAIAQAGAAGKTVLFDFYADWCVECKRMERYTFPESAVQQVLTDVVMLKVDVTAQTPADVELQQRFGIIGPPATLFFRELNERRPLRLIGYEKPEPFAARVERSKLSCDVEAC
jgi:thiol:disulfide interchange protein DsbD